MVIHLNEIPPEGQSWVLTNKTGELNEPLKDLIGSVPFSVEFTILPLNPGTFDLRGSIKTEIPEACSRCGLDFKFDVNEKFHELLMPALDTPRDAHFAKANHYSDLNHEGPEVVEYEGNSFFVSEYIHEIVALSETTNPAPPEDAQGNCVTCKIPVRDRIFSYEEEMPEPESPFAALKKLKT